MTWYMHHESWISPSSPIFWIEGVQFLRSLWWASSKTWNGSKFMNSLHRNSSFNFSITSIFSLSTSRPFCDTFWQGTTRSLIMKLHFLSLGQNLSPHIFGEPVPSVLNMFQMYHPWSRSHLWRLLLNLLLWQKI